jgi:hypothetical protein
MRRADDFTDTTYTDQMIDAGERLLQAIRSVAPNSAMVIGSATSVAIDGEFNLVAVAEILGSPAHQV